MLKIIKPKDISRECGVSLRTASKIYKDIKVQYNLDAIVTLTHLKLYLKV